MKIHYEFSADLNLESSWNYQTLVLHIWTVTNVQTWVLRNYCHYSCNSKIDKRIYSSENFYVTLVITAITPHVIVLILVLHLLQSNPRT